MENKIYQISNAEAVIIREQSKQKGTIFLAEIDGSKIQDDYDFLKTMSNVFQFPREAKSLDGYLDWIRDLTWLNQEKVVLIIYNIEKFYQDNFARKREIINYLQECVLPWWEHDVEKHRVEGKAKPFNVYLVIN